MHMHSLGRSSAEHLRQLYFRRAPTTRAASTDLAAAAGRLRGTVERRPSPESLARLQAAALALFDDGLFAESATCCWCSLRAEPSDSAIRELLVASLRSDGRLTEAAEAVREALRLASCREEQGRRLLYY